jgi:diaminohydroxyphosphoribosylaminopyrimidine deaminase/5-amino-6-(5-phosphoribosylamino)uracil reductase
MNTHEHHMRRCLQLACNGAGHVAPNPMVGAVLVHGDRVLAEGWHRSYGGPHAEVECLRAFGEGPVPSDAVMYVNLEPCSHHGKTPPCVDLLIARAVKKLVVACEDPNPLVKEEGYARAREAGIEVIEDVLRDESRWLNRRFMQSIEQQRPYIILKWARSADGFLDDHGRTARISSSGTDVLVHRWRSEEQAIMVGSRTVINDDPSLTVRRVEGSNPLRVLIDRQNQAAPTSKVFDGSAPTLLITANRRSDVPAEQQVIGMDDDPIDAVIHELQHRSVRSVIVEGGAELLGHFLSRGLWNEARVITGDLKFGGGTSAPALSTSPVRSLTREADRIDLFVNGIAPETTWAW